MIFRMRISLDVPIRHHASAAGAQQSLKTGREQKCELLEPDAAAGLLEIRPLRAGMAEHLDRAFHSRASKTRTVAGARRPHDGLQIDHARRRAQPRAAESAVGLPSQGFMD